MVNLSVNAQKQFPKFTLHDSGFPSQKHLTSQFYSWIILAYINVTMVHVSGFTSSKGFSVSKWAIRSTILEVNFWKTKNTGIRKMSC